MRGQLLIALALTACATPDDTVSELEALTNRVGVDYSFARPSPSSLHADGYTFAARYTSYDSGKNISHGEADQLIAAGLDVVTNWESTANSALNGYARGVSDAQASAGQAAAAGAPGTRPIYFSVDFDATPAQQGVINDYFDGVASVIGRNRTGAYGGYYVIKRLFDAGKITWGWQTYAWSGGQWDSRAQLRQIQNGILGDQADEDEATTADFGQWGQAVIVETGPPPPAPPLPTACGSIEPGHGLSRGQVWYSCDNRFELAMQGDGNLVVYSSGVATWSSGTAGRGGDVAIMQGDGNFVLYDEHSHPLFNSRSSGHPGAWLAIQTDGNVVVYDGGALWSSGTGGMPTKPASCGAIAPGEGLAIGEAIASCDNRFVFVQQGDGNLVLYEGGTPLWNAHTEGTGANRLIMQGDGNLVAYTDEGKAVWSSGTAGHPGTSLAVQGDGNTVLYDAGRPLWFTSTSGH